MHATSLFRYIIPFTAAFMAVQATSSPGQYIFGAGGAGQDELMDVPSNDKPSLGDLMTVDRSLSIFYAYLRESTSLSQRLVSPATSTTIFAPRDATIQSLTRKPHQGEPAVEIEGSFSTEDEKARAAYLERWVGTHMVAGSDLKLHDGVVVESLAGSNWTISFTAKKDKEMDDDEWQKIQILPGNVNIVGMKEARDGRIYIIDGTLL